MHTLYERIFDDLPAYNTVYIGYRVKVKGICIGFWPALGMCEREGGIDVRPLHAMVYGVSRSCLLRNLGLARTTHIYTPYMTVYLVNSLPTMPCIDRIDMVLADPTDFASCCSCNKYYYK